MLFGDVETTGLLKPEAAHLKLQPYITEICIIKLDDNFEFIDEVNTFVKPPVPIPPEITRITGITDETVSNAPKFINIYKQLVDIFLGERYIIGHNISFDLGVLWAELSRHSLEFHFPWPPEWICTVEKSMSIEQRRINLKTLHTYATGREHDDAHRAKSDVVANITCFKWLCEKGLI